MLSEFLLTDMARRRSASTFIDAKAMPLHRQLYEAVRRAILDGHLAPGERLPSTRDLALDLDISRNTVIAALGQLTVEGYVTSLVGSGTYVNSNLQGKLEPGFQAPGQSGNPGNSGSAKIQHLQASRPHLSQRGAALLGRYTAAELEVQPFTNSSLDFSPFPMALWQRLQNKHWRCSYPEMLDYSDAGGHAALRRAVADYLRVFRSMQLGADQVVITSGTQQSIGLCAQLLANSGDTVWMEDPAYWGAVKALTASGLLIHPVPVDSEGIAPGLKDEAVPPRLIYATPSHQYPTGAVMSLARRQQLLATARQHNAWILEDDYDSEFRFSGPPVSSLEGLDRDDRVVYMGTFSKVLYPGLKLGYLVVPKILVEPFRTAHYDLNRPGQLHLQAALAEFIDMGHFAGALRKARISYAQRRLCLLEGLAPCLALNSAGRSATVTGAEQGLHLCIRLPVDLDDQALARHIARRGLLVRPLSRYCLQRSDMRGLLVGYGYAPLEAVRLAAPVLGQLILKALESQ